VTDPEPVDVVTAARSLGVTPAAVRKRIRRGSLRAWKVDGVWRVVLPAGREPSYPTVTAPARDAGRDALIAQLQSENDFLRGLVADLTRRLPELPAGPRDMDRTPGTSPERETGSLPQSPPRPPGLDRLVTALQESARPPPRRSWLQRLLGR